jgi:hypothetical protein
MMMEWVTALYYKGKGGFQPENNTEQHQGPDGPSGKADNT